MRRQCSSVLFSETPRVYSREELSTTTARGRVPRRPAQVDLVDLEGREPGRAVGRERRDDAVGHVGAGRVADDGAARRDRRGDEGRDGALAVGAGDEHAAPLTRHGVQHAGVDAQGQPTADHRAGALAEGLGETARGPSGRQRQSGAERIACVGQKRLPFSASSVASPVGERRPLGDRPDRQARW